MQTKVRELGRLLRMEELGQAPSFRWMVLDYILYGEHIDYVKAYFRLFGNYVAFCITAVISDMAVDSQDERLIGICMLQNDIMGLPTFGTFRLLWAPLKAKRANELEDTCRKLIHIGMINRELALRLVHTSYVTALGMHRHKLCGTFSDWDPASEKPHAYLIIDTAANQYAFLSMKRSAIHLELCMNNNGSWLIRYMHTRDFFFLLLLRSLRESMSDAEIKVATHEEQEQEESERHLPKCRLGNKTADVTWKDFVNCKCKDVNIPKTPASSPSPKPELRESPPPFPKRFNPNGRYKPYQHRAYYIGPDRERIPHLGQHAWSGLGGK
ncbi:hypothetical protein BC832DRAFT_539986 [Gaertneriomyces semiglobifer]|nr:hypothetical protein BC832DRAFT_539986 [Gaertneriomyces semiglobifer]